MPDSAGETSGHAGMVNLRESMAAGLSLELEFQTELYDPGPILLRGHDTEDGI